MLHAAVRFRLPIVVICFLCSCINVTLEPDAQSIGPNPDMPLDVTDSETTAPVPSDTVLPPSDLILTDLAAPNEDTNPPWIACNTLCDCPLGNDCINERCIEGNEPIYCCTHPDCPAAAVCWSAAGVTGVCP